LKSMDFWKMKSCGIYQDEIMWHLSGNDTAWKKPKRKKTDPKPVKCKVCHEIFAGLKACPTCGTALRKFGKKIESTDEKLVELKAKKKNNKDMSWDEKRKLMGALIWHVKKKGYNPGWAAHAYKEYTGVWPNDGRVKNVSSIEPTGNIKNLLTYILIKKAHQYKKLKAQGGN